MCSSFCLLGLLVVCQSSQPTTSPQVILDMTPPVQLRIGCAPYPAPKKLHEILTPLLQDLSQKTGSNDSLVLTKDYAEPVQMLNEKALEIAALPTDVPVSTKEQAQTLQPLVSLSRRLGSPLSGLIPCPTSPEPQHLLA
jgi:ABC-type phosphate/phosphonate transport system substrate-binding protein